MKKIFLAILIMFSFCSLAISQNTTDSPTSTKKQAATKNSSQSKKLQGKPTIIKPPVALNRIPLHPAQEDPEQGLSDQVKGWITLIPRQ